VKSEAKEANDMQQPIIDPDKVNAWTESMRGAFSGGPGGLGTWLFVGITVAVLFIIVFTAWRSSRHMPDPNQDLPFLIDAKPGPKALGHAPGRH
jgi:hypothetical protein